MKSLNSLAISDLMLTTAAQAMDRPTFQNQGMVIVTSQALVRKGVSSAFFQN